MVRFTHYGAHPDRCPVEDSNLEPVS